jgi:hypothetical protein
MDDNFDMEDDDMFPDMTYGGEGNSKGAGEKYLSSKEKRR